MQKLRKRIGICFLLAAIVWSLGILHDRKMLNDNLIRLHVVANSDMSQDQNIKLQVKDAVVETRLPHPWDSPGKYTGVGCHFLLQCMKGKSESEVTQSCPTLSDPMDCSLPGSFVHDK